MKNLKKVLPVFFALILSIAVTGCDNDENDTEPQENEVLMQSSTFVPASITVVEGTEVTWVNEDNIVHTTTSDDGLWDSGNMNQGDTFSYVFDEPGTYNYHCQIHPVVMTGEVIVQSSAENGTY